MGSGTVFPIHQLDPKYGPLVNPVVDVNGQNPASGGYAEGGRIITTPHTGGSQLDGQQGGTSYTTPEHQLNPGNMYSESGSEIKLVDGFYQAEGSAFKFSEYYYNRLWSTGRGAPFVQAEEVLNTAKTITPDRMAGFNRYVNDAFEMVYNPATKEVWHIQPLRE